MSIWKRKGNGAEEPRGPIDWSKVPFAGRCAHGVQHLNACEGCEELYELRAQLAGKDRELELVALTAVDLAEQLDAANKRVVELEQRLAATA